MNMDEDFELVDVHLLIAAADIDIDPKLPNRAALIDCLKVRRRVFVFATRAQR